MADDRAAACSVCRGRTWIDVKIDKISLHRQRWPSARFMPGLNDCPACTQADADAIDPPPPQFRLIVGRIQKQNRDRFGEHCFCTGVISKRPIFRLSHTVIRAFGREPYVRYWHFGRSAVAEHAVTEPALRVDRISLCLIVGLVATELTVLLGLFWI